MSDGASVLVLEDETDLLFLLERNLAQQGYRVSACETLADAEEARAREPHDLYLLDVNLPDGSAFDWLTRVRQRGDMTPAVFLTARAEEADRLLGFAVGGDDYVVKPFSMAELLARLAAIVRRTRGPERDRYACATFEVDFARYLLVRGDEEIALTYLEAELLRYLVARPGKAVGRRELLERVWGYDRYPSTRTVDTHVLNLRKKLERDPSRPRHLLTVHGVGYKFQP
ncbi:MAG: DNA-binding response regulator [Planctomycetota bacterium]|nr:MAG: DNA-binding response regulator [Planctomycetota bacterium]